MYIFNKIISIFSWLTCVSVMIMPVAIGDEKSPTASAALEVKDIVTIALANNPTREVFDASRAVADAEVINARMWSNPELELSSGRARARNGGAKENIHGIELKQKIERPGKRTLRIAVAKAGRQLTDSEVAVDAFTLESEVRRACFELASTELLHGQVQENMEIAEQLYQTVLGRMEAKETEASELARAKLELLTATIIRDQQSRLLSARRAAVQAWCGGKLPEHFSIQGALPESPPVIDRAQALNIAIQNNPRLRLLLAKRETQQAVLWREKKAWIPDFTLGGFSERESDSNTLGLSLGIEIPLWNSNQGGIALAQAEQRKVEAELRAEKKMILRAVELAWQTYDSQRIAVGMLLNEAKNVAQQVLKTKLDAYAAREVPLSEVIEARRSAQIVKASVLDTQRAATEAWLDLGQAVGSYMFNSTIHPVTKSVGGLP